MFNLTTDELRALRPLNTPRKIQDYLESLPHNFEPEGDTCLPPRRVLREQRAHCIEGATLAALALRLHGYPPLLVDMTAAPFDYDHVIAVFKQRGRWGAISKTNHAVLRYREPIYRTVRELVMSYFHEYTDKQGRKTLRSFTRPVDLSRFDRRGWMTTEDEIWYIANHLVEVTHMPILTRAQIATLRRADPLELKFGEIEQWRK